MGRIKHWCKVCEKPMMDCICPRQRRKLKVYGHFTTRPWHYAYVAAYTKEQFARLMGSNLYLLGGSRVIFIEDNPKFIDRALCSPFSVFYPSDWSMSKYIPSDVEKEE